jgi:hypothetical protein
MSLISLSSEQKKIYCKIISTSKNEYMLLISFGGIIKLQTDIFSFEEVEISCELPKKFVFNPPQMNNLKVKTSFLKESTLFTWVILKKYFSGLDEKEDVEKVLNSITISFRCEGN